MDSPQTQLYKQLRMHLSKRYKAHNGSGFLLMALIGGEENIECSVNIILISVYFSIRRIQWTVNKVRVC